MASAMGLRQILPTHTTSMLLNKRYILFLLMALKVVVHAVYLMNRNYSADTPYFHGTRMTPMERISTDLVSVFCGLAINEKTPFIRVYQSNPCHPCAVFKG
jgi:hypothetical protein